MEQKKRSVQENMMFNTVGSLVYYACQWFMTIVVVKLSGFADSGIFALAMSMTAAPAIIGLFNMRSYQVSDLKEQYSDHLYIRSRWYTNVLSFLICALLVLWHGYSMKKASVILVYMLFKVVEGFADVYYGIDQKEERLDYAGISMTLRGIGSLIFFIIGLLVSHNLLIAVAMMTVFSLAVIFFYDRRKVAGLSESVRTGKPKIQREQLLQLLWTCFPLAVVAFLNNLSLNVPKLYLEEYFGETMMGIYNSVASPTIVIQLAATTLFAPLIPPLTEKYEKKDHEGFMNICKRFSLLALGLTVVCLAAVLIMEKTGILETILVVLFKESIREYVFLFLPVVGISILIAINACLFSVCTLLRSITPQYVIGAAGVISAYGCTWYFVKRYDMRGVVLALAGTLLIQIVIQMCLIVKKLHAIKPEKTRKNV
ncbi:MAG: lipopolysaccharide biosynthesis protein [Lachnospiraceae bacterium]